MFYVHLMEVLPFDCCKCDNDLYCRHLCHRRNGLFIIDHVYLRVALCDEPGLIPIDGATDVVLHLIYPLSFDFFLVG